MIYQGDCISECIKYFPINNVYNQHTIDFISVDTHKLYCIEATVLSYDFSQSTAYITSDDITACIINSIYDVDLYQDMVFINLDLSKTKRLTNIDFYTVDFYNRVKNLVYKNCKLTSDNTISIKQGREFELYTNSLMSAITFSLDYEFTLYNKDDEFKDNYFIFEYFTSANILEIKLTSNSVTFTIYTYNNGEKVALFTTIIELVVNNSSQYKLTIDRDADSKKITINIKENGVDIFNYDDVLIPISVTKSFSRISIKGLLYQNNITASSSIDELFIYYPKLKKPLYNIIDFDLSQKSDDDFYNQAIYFNMWQEFDENLEQSNTSFRYLIKDFNKMIHPIEMYYKNYFYRNNYNKMYTRFICNSSIICIEGIHTYKKDEYDKQYLSFQTINDTLINAEYQQLNISDELKNPLVIYRGTNLPVNRCYGIKLRFTRLGKDAIKDLFSNAVKISFNKIGIFYSDVNTNYVDSYHIPQDETGSTIVPHKIFTIDSLDQLAVFNHIKNRFVHIEGVIPSFKDVLSDDNLADEIFINTIFIVLEINGKLYSASSEGLSSPIKVKTNESIPVLFTIMY